MDERKSVLHHGRLQRRVIGAGAGLHMLILR
jgi:hypothetical protein